MYVQVLAECKTNMKRFKTIFDPQKIFNNSLAQVDSAKDGMLYT